MCRLDLTRGLGVGRREHRGLPVVYVMIQEPDEQIIDQALATSSTVMMTLEQSLK